MSSWHDRRSTIHPDTPVQVVVLTCSVAILSYLAARISGSLVLRPEMIWPVWPGCAFLVAVLLLTPRTIWPLLLIAGLIGFALYDVQEALPTRATVLLLLADALEILVAAFGVSYVLGGVPRLKSVKSLAKYALFAVILAPISVASAAANALEGDSWWVGFFTEALALLTLTPAILSWVEIADTRFEMSKVRYLEAASMCLGLLILSYFTFVASDSQTRPAMLYSIVPFLLWAGLRFGVPGTSNSIAIVGFLAIWGTVHSHGPFTGNTPVHDVLSLQLFLLVAASSFMVLAVVVEQHRAAEWARSESEERLRLAAKAGRMFAYSWDAATDVIERSGESSEILGVDQATVATGRAASAMIHPDDKDRVEAALDKVAPEHPGIQIEYRIIRPDGAVVWLERNSHAYFDDKGNVKRMVGMIVDGTERKQAEQALRESDERLRLAVQAGRMYSFEWDVATDTVVRSPEHVKVLSVAGPLRLTHQQFVDKIHPDDRSQFLATIAGLTPENPSGEVSYRMSVSDGVFVWLKASGHAFFDGEGRMLRVVGMVADVTKQKLSEEALRASEARLRLAQWAARIGTFDLDLRTGVDIWTPETEALYGLQPGGFEGTLTAFENLIHPDDRERIRELTHEMIRTGQPAEEEWRVVWPDGGVRWIAGRAQVLMDESGEPSRMIGVNIDVTERKLAEQALVGMSRKLIEAQEQDRARVARDLHDDINQQLALLAIDVEQLRQRFPDSAAEISSGLTEIRDRVTAIAADVQSISHHLHSPQLEILGIVAAIRGFCREFAAHQKVTVDFTHDTIPKGVSHEASLCLFRVVQEALHNAVKHSNVRHYEVRLGGSASDLHLTVSDHGSGFDTGAAVGSGGLGLTSMRERVRLVNGTITIDSEPMRGTSIHVRVPLASAPDSERAAG
jgi:PAS domain S-box-containing protein